MREKKRSLKKWIGIFWLIWVFLILFLVAVYSSMYLREYRKVYIEDFLVFEESYTTKLRHDIRLMQDQIENFYVSDTNYHQITKGSLSEAKKIKSLYYIRNNLQTQTAVLDCTGGYFFYDEDEDILRSTCAGYSENMVRLNETLKHTLQTAQGKNVYLGYFTHEEETFLISYIGTKGKVVGYILDLNGYFPEIEETAVAFINEENQVMAVLGKHRVSQQRMVEIKEKNQDLILLSDVVFVCKKIEEFSGLHLVIARDLRDSVRFWHHWEFWVLMVLVPMAAIFFSFVFYRILQQALLNPVTHILSRIQEMKQENDTERPEKQDGKAEFAEYREINKQIDEMLIQIERLQEEKIQESLRANEAQLQYYQLQTDPHFYLNCLNTISTLLENHSPEIAHDLIIALSSHFRYMFRGNRTWVTIEDEVKEAQDYCNIYSIRKGFPIFLDIEMQETVKKSRIPILSIQTFVENSIKHFGKENQVLMIRVWVSQMQQENGRKLNIRIADNGLGFEPSVLEELNQEVTKYAYKSTHVGTDNLKYRLSLLYKEKAQIYFYNASYGGAVVEMILPEVDDEHIAD